MRKPTKGCNKRDANYHRNDHIDDHGKHFFKVLIGDFHKRLVSNFLAHYVSRYSACGIPECGHYLLRSGVTCVTNSILWTVVVFPINISMLSLRLLINVKIYVGTHEWNSITYKTILAILF